MRDEQKEKLPPAYFRSISLKNLRCFGREVTLDLTDEDDNPAQWTVLLGENGTGKTTLMQSLVGLQPLDVWSADQEVMISASRFNAPSKIERRFRSGIRGKKAKLEASIGYGGKLSSGGGESTTRINVRWEKRSFRSGGFIRDNIGGLKCYSYGASRYLDEDKLLDEEDDFYERSVTSGLFEDDVGLPNVEAWLREIDYSFQSGNAKAKYKLDKVKSILAGDEEGVLPDVEKIEFDRKDNDERARRVFFRTPYGRVTIDQLSLGYRTMIAWVVDLARRLFKRYPESDNPIKEPAVCLVDEIDLHLHPKWQRKIIEFLGDRFENTQFVVTAHSPLVVQAAEDANIALLRRVEVEDGDDYVEIENDPTRIRNWRVDQILTSDLFDLDSARPPRADKLMQEREEILAKEELTKEDEQRLDEIEEEMGDLPTGETPDDLEAMNLIRQAARELKEDA